MGGLRRTNSDLKRNGHDQIGIPQDGEHKRGRLLHGFMHTTHGDLETRGKRTMAASALLDRPARYRGWSAGNAVPKTASEATATPKPFGRHRADVIMLVRACLLAASAWACGAMYADEMGVFDWAKENIGQPSAAAFSPGGKVVFVASAGSGTLAGVQAKTGVLAWRRVLPEGEGLACGGRAWAPMRGEARDSADSTWLRFGCGFPAAPAYWSVGGTCFTCTVVMTS